MSTAHLHAVPPPTDLVELYSEAPLPTRHGLLRVMVFRERGTDKEHVVAVKGDLLPEGDERFFVNLRSPLNATIGTTQGIGTIKDDANIDHDYSGSGLAHLYETARRKFAARQTSATILRFPNGESHE